MIGNDIIDLSINFLPEEQRQQRFLEKIFTPAEQARIRSSENPEEQAKVFWAMKEAAWKAHQRRKNLPRVFAPTAFFCHFEGGRNKNRGEVHFQDYQYTTRVTINTHYCHCLAAAFPHQEVHFGILPDSAGLQQAFFDSVLKMHQSLRGNQLHIKKDQNAVPHLYYGRVQTKIPFSFSGHGKYKAYAVELRNC